MLQAKEKDFHSKQFSRQLFFQPKIEQSRKIKGVE